MNRFAYSIPLLAIAAASMGQSFIDSFENADYSNNDATGGTIVSAVTWTAINNSNPVGLTGWSVGNQTFFPANSGNDYISADFLNTDLVGGIDNWLISPVLTFHNGDTIQFFTRTVDTPALFADRLFLKLSTNGTSSTLGDFSNTLVAVNPDLTDTGYPNTWTQFTATVTGVDPSGVSGRFAFNYNIPNAGAAGTASDYIGIDDVSFNAAPVPEPATMAVLGLGALALLRRRRAR